MKHRRQRKHSGGRRAPTRRLSGPLPAVLMIAALCLWATIPLGSAADWAKSTVVLSCLLAAAVAWFSAPPSPIPPEPRWPRVGAFTAIGATAVWMAFQCAPLPVRFLARLQPAAREGYQTIFAPDGWATIGFSRFIISSEAVLWAAYLLLTWAAIRAIRTRNSVKLAGFALAAIGTGQALAGILSRGSAHQPNHLFASSRISGTFPGSNSFSGFLSLTLLVTLGLILSTAPRIIKDSKGRSARIVIFEAIHSRQLLVFVVLALAFIVQSVAILVSGSRGAVISVSLTIVLLMSWFFVESRHRGRGHAVRFLAPVLAVLFALGTGGAYALIATRFRSLLVTSDPSALSRMEIWRAAMKLLVSHPLGVGPGCFSEAFTRFQPEHFGGLRVYHAHSDYIELLCELGLPALLLMISVPVLFYRRIGLLLRLRPSGFSIWLWRAALCAVLCGLIHSFVDFNLSARPGVAVTFFVLLGITLGFESLALESRPFHKQSVYAMPPQIELPPVQLAGAGRDQSTTGHQPPATRQRSQAVVGKGAVRPSGAGKRSHAPPLPEDTPAPRRVFSRRFFPCGLLSLVACGFMALHAARSGMADWFAQVAYAANGGETGRYFWLSTPRISAEIAEQYLRHAVRLAPTSGSVLYMAGRSGIMHFAHRRREAMEEHSDQLKHDPRLALAIELAMRSEEASASAAAAPFLEAAIPHSPWNSDLHAALSLVFFHLAAAEESATRHAQFHGQAVSHARNAAYLAPNDIYTLTHLCEALSAGIRMGRDTSNTRNLTGLLTQWACRAIRLKGSTEDRILWHCHIAGIPPDDLISDPDMPLRALWNAYMMYNTRDLADSAIKCLDALDRAVSRFTNGSGTQRNAPDRRELNRYRELTIREHSKWLLRKGNWKGYRDILDNRRVAHMLLIDRRFEDVSRAIPSTEFLLLKLKAMDESIGLDCSHRLQWSRLKIDIQRPREASRIIAEVALQDSPEAVDLLARYIEEGCDLDAEDPGLLVARARDLMHRQHYDVAANILAELAGNQKIPFAWKHRVDLELALALVQQDRIEQARGILLRSAASCPTDPDILVALRDNGAGDELITMDKGVQSSVNELLADTMPDHEIGMYFLGNMVEMRGFELVRRIGPRKSSIALRLFWRFWGEVPDDIEAFVQLKDSGNRRVYEQRKPFAKYAPLLFAAGRPQMGRTLIMEFALPPTWEATPRLAIALRRASNRTWLPSAEGLLSLEMWDWGSHISPVAQKLPL